VLRIPVNEGSRLPCFPRRTVLPEVYEVRSREEENLKE
jgi:hypothetical protein